MLSYAILPLAMSAVSFAASLPHGLASVVAPSIPPQLHCCGFRSSGSDDNTTGVPVVLTETGTEGSATHMVFATNASQPDNTWGSFSLSTGSLLPIPASTDTNATDLSVSSGDAPTFAVSSDGDLPSAVQAYCAVANTDPNMGTLHSGDSSGQDIVVYEASEDSADYDSALAPLSSCASLASIEMRKRVLYPRTPTS
ncbi:uncharacterized protein B0H18DRAFT_1124164 [Fomitopsis serialis]|uniref:uncharacterized protein n=1 Tax=Fomitopsis serialis TaxID=139415 RepID=UPI002008C125|nr:uncharacterized protein B0H18DRAFT_1124164 [Neoantrodia serialis]KAH9916525.1 hypothetical protein B0H18DRAFT_1124164 [Neoantrodia serialis]